MLPGQQQQCNQQPPKLCGAFARHPRRSLRQCRRHACRSQAGKASTADLSLFSPSKINLFLRVVRRREDGYHDLASLFHVIDLGDSMDFTVLPGSQEDSLTCNMEGVPTDDSNLVIKVAVLGARDTRTQQAALVKPGLVPAIKPNAFKLFRERTGRDQHFRVHLEKRVPHGAGLGGGSANAATALWAANQLAGCPATNEELLEWSGAIGSDISVFFSQGAAYCTGRGEIVENVEPPLPFNTKLLLVKPPVGLATPTIFKALDLGRRSTVEGRDLLQQLSQQRRLTPDLCVNDLEQPAFDTLPELMELKTRLQEESSGQFSAVFMTGSGSTMVCVGSDEPPAWLREQQHVFVAPARLISRQPGEWYSPQARVALIAGASGFTGRHLCSALDKASAEEWSKVYGIARRALTPGSKVTKISVDLSHRDKAIESLAKCKDATHLFFCAYQSTGSFSKDVPVNVSMFTNMIEAAEAAGCKLQHVHFVSGTKWYGNHIGPIKTPSREDDPRAMPPNFYYNFEDYCTQRVADGATWAWSSVRPNPVCGFSTGSVMNLTMTLAVYASICKAQGLPFRFPGTPQAYHALLEVIDVELLAESMQWCSTQKACQNKSFNVSNGDVFRWSEVWPILGEWFGLKTAQPQRFSMVELPADQEGTWVELQKEHGLQPIPYNEVATWAFGDWVFGQEQDWFSNVTRMRHTGFQGMQIDSKDMFLGQFQELRAEKIIP